MEAKFTKGEWRQSHRGKPNGMYSTEVYDEQGETICTLAWHKVPIVGGFETDREANAKLIAAAPELFEACVCLARLKDLVLLPEPIKGVSEEFMSEFIALNNLIKMADSAIKKATE